MTGKTIAALAGVGALLGLLFTGKKSKAATGPIVPPYAPTTPPPTSVKPAVSASLPVNYRRIAQSEVTPELHEVADQILEKGFAPGTFNPFTYDGMRYAALVERTSSGRVVVSLAVER